MAVLFFHLGHILLSARLGLEYEIGSQNLLPIQFLAEDTNQSEKVLLTALNVFRLIDHYILCFDLLMPKFG